MDDAQTGAASGVGGSDFRGARALLTINGGSSSIKFALFVGSGDPDVPQRRLSGQVQRLGTPGASLSIKAGDGSVEEHPLLGADPAAAVKALADFLQAHLRSNGGLAGIVHRVVHGGDRFFQPQRVDAAMLDGLRDLARIDPMHLPAEIELIEQAARVFPGVPQIACFDTAFHHDLPAVSRVLPIPRQLTDAGLRRFGFHGLSYEYLLRELQRVAGAEAAGGRVILAHLGSGASMAAVKNGRCIDTTMAFTPTAGLVMGTRSGDLDPGLLIYLLRHGSGAGGAAGGMSIDALDELVNKQSGLKGISGGTADMRDLQSRRRSDPAAHLAVSIFCYTARKFIGALAAALGGLDVLVFSAGIGEHDPAVRAEICDGLGFLGVNLDPSSNAAATGDQAVQIAGAGGGASVWVIPTDEEITLARAGLKLLQIA